MIRKMGVAMANDPKGAKEKRGGPTERQNGQGDHEGSAHAAEEFVLQLPPKPQRPSGQRNDQE